MIKQLIHWINQEGKRKKKIRNWHLINLKVNVNHQLIIKKRYFNHIKLKMIMINCWQLINYQEAERKKKKSESQSIHWNKLVVIFFHSANPIERFKLTKWLIGTLSVWTDLIVAIKLRRFGVPGAVSNGSSVWLHCDYDLEGDSLYSVKWYKNYEEFYGYLPLNSHSEVEHKTYYQRGINIDVSKSANYFNLWKQSARFVKRKTQL